MPDFAGAANGGFNGLRRRDVRLLSTTTLSTWRCTKRYPLPYVKVGRLVRYRLVDVDAFELAQLQQVAANDN